MAQKVLFPESVQERLTKFECILTEEGFFDNEDDFPKDMKETAKVHLWNILGEVFITKFIEGKDDYLITEDEMNKVLTTTIIQTNLDSLMTENLIDGIEDENGEMRYWVTPKGKDICKDMDIDLEGDVDNS